MATNDPSIQLKAVSDMQDDWALVDALMGGTKAMRAAGKRYLPPFPKESDKKYKSRLAVSTLLPAYKETVGNMTGRVFAQPIQLGEDIDESIADQLSNIDLRGNNLQVWAKDWFEKALAYGLGYVLVDYPRADGIRTKAQEKAAGVRPYTVFINPKQVIGWRVSYENGHEVLKQFRYYETVQEDDGAFDAKDVMQIRVLEPGKWSVYRKSDKGEWVLFQEGVTSLTEIPLVCFYTKRTGALSAEPPLIDLAYLNVKHWQSQSDQDNILHIARVPILTLIGADENTQIEIGSSALKIPQGGDVKYVEHTGASISAGAASLKDLIDEMRMAGAKLLHKEVATVKTVQQANEDNAESKSQLQMMAESFEDAIDQVIHLFCKWQGMEEKGSVEVQGNFDADNMPQQSMTVLTAMKEASALSAQTLFNEGKRRGFISDEVEWDDEAERIAGEEPDDSDEELEEGHTNLTGEKNKVTKQAKKSMNKKMSKMQKTEQE